jgi:hypothetical protein
VGQGSAGGCDSPWIVLKQAGGDGVANGMGVDRLPDQLSAPIAEKVVDPTIGERPPGTTDEEAAVIRSAVQEAWPVHLDVPAQVRHQSRGHLHIDRLAILHCLFS